jgi:hypothetical protein
MLIEASETNNCMFGSYATDLGVSSEAYSRLAHPRFLEKFQWRLQNRCKAIF